MSNSSIGSNQIQDEVDQLLEGNWENSYEEILEEILAVVEWIDFRDRAGIKKVASTKLNEQHYTVIVVEEILNIAEQNGVAICLYQELCYIYNHKYWVKLEDQTVESFLKDVALKAGVDRTKACYYEFTRKLLSQFRSAIPKKYTNARGGQIRINLQNAVMEFNNEGYQMKKHHPDYFLTYLLPFSFDKSNRDAPLFFDYLSRVLPEEDSQDAIRDYLGSLFISREALKLEKVLLLYGPGGNGKSVMFDIIYALLGGESNVSNYAIQSLTSENGKYRARISDKLVNYSSEMSKQVESEFFKQLASGEPVQARHLYGNPFTIRNYAKLIFNVNVLPQNIELSTAFFRRLLIVPFFARITKSEQDPDLANKIIASELPAIFNWAMDGLKEVLQNRKLTECQKGLEIVERYRIESDTVIYFMEECSYKPSTNHKVPLQDIYQEYRVFCVENGYRSVSNKVFRKRLENNHYQIKRLGPGNFIYACPKHIDE